MNTSTEFKQALRAGKLSEAFLLAMSNAPELHITTWIASASEDSPNHSQDCSKRQAGNFLRTHINLIEGKIDNEIGEKLISNGNPTIQQFHLQQVTQAHQTIQQNLQSLQKMFHLMSAFEQQRQAGKGNTQINWVNVESNSLAAPDDTVELKGNKAIGSLGAAESSTISTDKESHTTESYIVESEPGESNSESAKVEPQLPSFTHDDDGVVDDLLSLADLDEKSTDESEEDWGEWLEEDEANIKPEIIDLNSLDSNHTPN